MESNPPRLSSPEERAAFEAAAAPLRAWLRTMHPHHVVHVTDLRAELFEGQGVVGEVRGALTTYQREAHKTAGTMPDRDRVFMASMGLAGEAGEVVDELKKVHFHAKPFDRTKLVRELGDVLWYLAELCTAHGIDLAEVAAANLAKLRARHGGETFKPHAEQNRSPEACAVVWNNEALNKGPQLGRFSPDERAELDDLKRKAFEAAAQPPHNAVPSMVVHGGCVLSSPEATPTERERCNNEVARQVVDAHKMLDRLGAPGGSKSGSVRERLFYLLHLRGWEPNVRSPWGDDVVPDTLAHVEVKGQPAPDFTATAMRDGLLDPNTVTIDGHKLVDVVNFLRHVRPFFAEACATSREHTPAERSAKSTVTCTVPVFVWDAFVNAADLLFPRGGLTGPDEERPRPNPPRPHFEQPGER